CISEAVRTQWHEELGIGFADIGEQRVKNIVRPVRVYRVNLNSGVVRTKDADDSLISRLSSRGRWWATGAVLALAGIVLIWFMLPIFKSPPPAVDSPPPLSIAILPFAAASDSAADKQFAEELTHDLTTGVGRKRMATVAAPSVASAFTGRTVDLPSVGRQLNVRYI